MKLENVRAYVDGEYVGELEMLTATIELEADNMGKAKAEFKVGDKVRVLDVGAILYGSDDYYDGMVTEVLRIDSDGDVYLRAKHGGEGVFLSVDEFHAIELVKGSDKMAKFNVGEELRITGTIGNVALCAKVGGKAIITGEFDDGLYPVKYENTATDGMPGGFIASKNLERIAEPRYKTEKRKARIGERILITNAGYTAGEYNNGDVFTFVSHYQGCASPGIITKELPRDAVGDSLQIYDKEYEVIVENAPNLAETADRVTELESRVAELEARLANKPKTVVSDEALKMREEVDVDKIARTLTQRLRTSLMTPNQRRADAIKQAREFVIELLTEVGEYHETRRGANDVYNDWLSRVEFVVNAERRTVVAIARTKHGNRILGKGIAKCAPGDVFNADIGKAIAAGRLYGLNVDEFVNAPQPDRVVVGHSIKYVDNNSLTGETRKVVKVEKRNLSFSNGRNFGTYEKADVNEYLNDAFEIISDTEAQY